MMFLLFTLLLIAATKKPRMHESVSTKNERMSGSKRLNITERAVGFTAIK